MNRLRSHSAFLAFACAMSVALAAQAQPEWPQFRGPNSSGISRRPAPIEFGPGTKALWSLSLDPGHSSPCVAGDNLFLTTYVEEDKRLAVVCVDRGSGTVRWERSLYPDRFEKGHPSFNPSSSSPCSDGQRVVAYFGSYGLVCFDLEGEPLWEIRMPVTASFAGNATSPAIMDDLVILYRGNRVDHFLLAVDKRTGEERWRVEQAEPFVDELACTACPIRYEDQIVLHSARAMQGIDLATGTQRWVTKLATTATTVPILAGEEVLVAAWNKMGEPTLRPEFPAFEKLLEEHDKNADGAIQRDELPTLWIFHRPEGAEAPMNGATIRFESADRDRDGRIDAPEWERRLADLDRFRAQYKTHGIVGIRLDQEGVLETTAVRTLFTRGIPEVPSPLVYGDYVYFVKNGGLLTCLNRETGRRVYQERTSGKGTHYASPVIAGDHLYTFAGDGTITVVPLGPEFEIAATNQMDDSVYASPAIADGILYVRTHAKLWAFGVSE